MNDRLIRSPKNQIIKQIKSLSQKKERNKQDLFIVEGKRFVMEIPCNWKIKFYALSESYVKNNNVDALYKSVETHIICDNIFNTISDTKTPQGIIAIVEKKIYTNCFLDEIFRSSKKGSFIIIDQLNDPGNVGAIIRTADAFLLDAIFLSEGSVDIYNTKVLRATMGSIFHLPIIQNIKLDLLLEKMRLHNIKIIGTHLDTNNYPHNIDLTSSNALLIGNEAHGLSELSKSFVDCMVKIPMLGDAESLNVSVAASIMMYEVMRQKLSCKGKEVD